MFSNSQFKIFSFSVMSNAQWKIKVITRRADIKLYPERPQMEFISLVNTNCRGILINITIKLPDYWTLCAVRFPFQSSLALLVDTASCLHSISPYSPLFKIMIFLGPSRICIKYLSFLFCHWGDQWNIHKSPWAKQTFHNTKAIYNGETSDICPGLFSFLPWSIANLVP